MAGWRVGGATAWLVVLSHAAAGQVVRHHGPRLTLRWHDPVRALPTPSSGVADEVRSIFAPVGVGVDWCEAEPGSASSEAGIEIVLLPDVSPGAAVPATTLGVVQRGSGPPAIWVYLGSVRRALGLTPLERPPTPAESAILARALGRVVAHEVVHLLAPRLSHRPSGLMKATLGRELTSRATPALEPAVWRALQPALAAAGVRRGGTLPDVASRRTAG